MDKVAIYLRKSRADEEIEKELGDGETLAKHRKALLKFAKEKGINIIKIHEEIVSGESLVHRPEMLELLKEVEQGMYDAILVMDMERLGRGNMQEQGLILDTLKKTKTKIITLRKTYDLNNDFDEEYSEFEAFMSRKEYRMITRRMQGGRVRSVEDGNYIGTYPPYGYLIREDKHSRTLTPNPEQADIVRMIFDMYTNQVMGCGNIAYELNRMGYKSYTGISWTSNAVINILKNPVYSGKITWKKKQIKKSITSGKKKDTKTRPKSEWIISDGKHDPLVDIQIFNKTQEIIDSKYHIPYQLINGPRNPLAGIIICKICGSKMVYRPYGDKDPHVICPKKCGNKSSKFKYIEEKLLQELKDWFESYRINFKKTGKSSKNNNILLYQKQLQELDKELKILHEQKLSLHDLLEQRVYDIDTFLERSKNIAERTELTKENIETIKSKIECDMNKVNTENTIPAIKKALDTYKFSDVREKNMLLKSILNKVEYLKNKDQKDDNFTLIIFPKLTDF